MQENLHTSNETLHFVLLTPVVSGNCDLSSYEVLWNVLEGISFLFFWVFITIYQLFHYEGLSLVFPAVLLHCVLR